MQVYGNNLFFFIYFSIIFKYYFHRQTNICNSILLRFFVIFLVYFNFLTLDDFRQENFKYKEKSSLNLGICVSISFFFFSLFKMLFRHF